MNFWPKGLVLIIILFMLSVVAFVVFAFSHDVVLVSKNYYQDEINYDAHYARLENSKKYKDDISLRYLASRDEIQILYTDSIGLKSLKLHFYNPISSKLDKIYESSYDTSGEKYISTSELSKGKWTLKMISSLNDIELYHEITFVKD